jgi:hypothetical protein
VPKKHPVRQPPSRRIEPGDRICGACGEGNPPVRNFCSRCGTTLADAEVVRRRWWQHLVRRRRPRSVEAGTRPWQSADGGRKRRPGGRIKRIYARLRPIVAVILLVGALVVGISPDLREKATAKAGDAVDWVMSRLRKQYAPLAPIEVFATSADPEHPAELAVDGNTLTAWIAPEGDPQPTLVARFDKPVDLDQINFFNGTTEGFKDRERARELHLVFDTGKTFDVTVDDLPDQRTYAIHGGDGIREVEIHVVSTYASLRSPELAVSEVEFLFQR